MCFFQFETGDRDKIIVLLAQEWKYGETDKDTQIHVETLGSVRSLLNTTFRAVLRLY